MYLRIPNLLSRWRWKGKINPLHEDVSAEGNAWFRSFAPLTPKSQHAFDLCTFGLFAGLLLPDAGREHLRTCLDIVNVFFIIDEYTDVQSTHVVRDMMTSCTDAIRNPHIPRPEGETVLGEIVRQFWERASRLSTPEGSLRFVDCFTQYCESVIQVAEWRNDGSAALTIDEYVTIRIRDAGVLPTQAICGLHLSIPQHVFLDSVVSDIMRISCELTIIDNDITSYNREQADGIGAFNIVTVIMRSLGLSLDGAIDWLEQRNEVLVDTFYAQLEAVPSFGPQVDAQLREYLDYVGNTRRAVWDWSFVSGRYFGDRGLDYAKTGLVPLIPAKTRNNTETVVEVLIMEEELAKWDGAGLGKAA
ncbi:terpenoid synthase [Dichomitus squalens LYAD-421 SS1]|uniref:Terpene synthase n=2 Tax=Dichomitus squalens TaxID=114155 RepID=A0A4Q9MCE4_9APHY|nr:terpenoid synthase [Dichomitus squalens LYAD-421 SS1]EJF62143.1 terpenoid synthase [Dichomitus squalens LYAD-421 SS1]TBU23988.1 terpenoid synthase [Dichomitus squalens]